jgi:hypothetical protein
MDKVFNKVYPSNVKHNGYNVATECDVDNSKLFHQITVEIVDANGAQVAGTAGSSMQIYSMDLGGEFYNKREDEIDLANGPLQIVISGFVAQKLKFVPVGLASTLKYRIVYSSWNN